MNRITDFDWRYAPLTLQAKYLLYGVIAPPWGRVTIATPLLLGMVGYALGCMQRIAPALDSTPPIRVAGLGVAA